MFKAEVILDSISPEDYRLTTMKLRYPKFIHGEFMTHRVFSRNASSSRAIPTAKYLEEVRSEGLRAAPIFWGKNQKGMQAAEELSNVEGHPDGPRSPRWKAEAVWAGAAYRAAECAEELIALGAHKQIVNRILEPFVHINVVVTATEYDNFFGLRLDEGAQPEMRTLAERMWEAYNHSVPLPLEPNTWHLPYFDWNETTDWQMSTLDADRISKAVSVARCARVSYESYETGKRSTIEEDLKLFEQLKSSGHWSPFEHQATPDTINPEDNSEHTAWQHREEWGNFRGWRQYRKMLPGEAVKPLPEKYLPF